MQTIKKKHLVTKQNVLNEMRTANMTLQELRFFSIYLSKIDPNNIATRVVRFPIREFQAIMELGRINIPHIQSVTNRLLCKVINIKTERGYTGFQLFKECRVDEDEHQERYVEIDAHDKALPLLFEFKERFFSYQLWNALHLKSSNQLRMYEILKQYEKIGERVMSIAEIKHFLGIGEQEYKVYSDFKKRVLDACQKALAQHTDIQFTYEPYGKKGKGGKILTLKFRIQKNTNHKNPISLEQFTADRLAQITSESESDVFQLDPLDVDTSIPHLIEDDVGSPVGSNLPHVYQDQNVAFFAEACDNEFTEQEMNLLIDALCRTVHQKSNFYETIDFERFHLLKAAYLQMTIRNPTYSRLGYLLAILDGQAGGGETSFT